MVSKVGEREFGNMLSEKICEYLKNQNNEKEKNLPTTDKLVEN